MLVENIKKGNWSGESVDIEICETNKTFEYYDYKFTLEHRTFEDLDGMSYTLLHGEGWSEPLTSLHFSEQNPSLEKQLRKAIVWISNYV